MPKVRKIFPAGVGNSIRNSFKLIFVSEGYLASERSKFISDCRETIEKILETPPFNLIKKNPFCLSAYAAFESGFHSYTGLANGLLSFDQSVLVPFLETVELGYYDEKQSLAEVCRKGAPDMGILGHLIVLLLPELETQPAGGEYEHFPNENEYYFVATTRNGEWHQVVLHGLCRMLGLGIEYEMGEQLLEPDPETYTIFNSNLEYFAEPPQSFEETKWKTLITEQQKNESLPLNANTIEGVGPNIDLSPIPATPEKIELWEGGGGYRHKVYRTSKDCLMRRQIGNSDLPIRIYKIPLCPSCKHFLNGFVGLPDKKRLSNQKLKYDAVNWERRNYWYPSAAQKAPVFPTIEDELTDGQGNFIEFPVASKPPDLKTGMSGDSRKPYWTFHFKLDEFYGIHIKNIHVKDTQEPTIIPSYQESEEEVFDEIYFSEFDVEFTDGTKRTFDLEAAFLNKESLFEFAEGGVGFDYRGQPNDDLYQRGLKLTLIDNILDPGNMDADNYCKVRLEIAIVFRGAKNDFDPGGVPVALDVFPQIGWTWFKEDKTTKEIRRFRGTVHKTLKNHMYQAMANMKKNIASFYTDSNSPLMQRGGYYGKETFFAASLFEAPRSWGVLFDYANLNLNQEKEFIGTYSTFDNEYTSVVNPGKVRIGKYLWHKNYEFDVWGETYLPNPFGPSIPTNLSTRQGIPFNVIKHARQGGYDNIHIHAKMMSPGVELEPGEPIHAPFCGHSCVHFHWRWTPHAVNGAIPIEKGALYRGWSEDGKAFTEAIAPLIPPNQRLRFAITKPGRFRLWNGSESDYDSDTDLIIGDTPELLDELYKTLWYSIDVKRPSAGERQVILEQGFGWGYRYSKPDEANTVVSDLVIAVLFDDLPDYNEITNEDMANFFAHEIYPDIRYVSGTSISSDEENDFLDQIPDGSFQEGEETEAEKSMEEL